MSERGRAERPLFFSTNKNKSAGRTLESIGITQTSHIKNDEYLASGTSSFRKACKSYIRDNKI